MGKTLEIEQHKDGSLVLVKTTDSGVEMRLPLSVDEVLSLAEGTRIARSLVLESRTRPGVTAASVLPVAKGALDADAHWTEVHMSLVLTTGLEMTFSLTPDLAQQLADLLPEYLAKIRAPKSTQ